MNSNESNFNINDFSKSQLEEIQKGLEQKLNVSVYAKKRISCHSDAANSTWTSR